MEIVISNFGKDGKVKKHDRNFKPHDYLFMCLTFKAKKIVIWGVIFCICNKKRGHPRSEVPGCNTAGVPCILRLQNIFQSEYFSYISQIILTIFLIWKMILWYYLLCRKEGLTLENLISTTWTFMNMVGKL